MQLLPRDKNQAYTNPTEVKTSSGTDYVLLSYVLPFPPYEMTVITVSESRSPIRPGVDSGRLVSGNRLWFCPPVCYQYHFLWDKAGDEQS